MKKRKNNYKHYQSTYKEIAKNRKKSLSKRSPTFKDQEERKTYFDRLFGRIFLSTLVLLAITLSANVFKYDVRDDLNEHSNLAKITSFIIGSFLPTDSTDHLVGSTTIYDSIEYKEDGINYITNQAFTGVEVIASGMVVGIKKEVKDQISSYTVTIKGVDGYTYIYRNLESIDCLLYQYLSLEKIIGATRDGQFSIEIIKDQASYSIYEIAQ